MTILALDIGSRRTGAAISDADNKIAIPLKTIEFNDISQLIDEIKKIIIEHNIDFLVIGQPKSLTPILTTNANDAENFAIKKTNEKLEVILSNISLPFEIIDERFSSVAAYKTLVFDTHKPDARQTKRRSQKKKKEKIIKKNVDALAAAYILQVYLDKKKREK